MYKLLSSAFCRLNAHGNWIDAGLLFQNQTLNFVLILLFCLRVLEIVWLELLVVSNWSGFESLLHLKSRWLFHWISQWLHLKLSCLLVVMPLRIEQFDLQPLMLSLCVEGFTNKVINWVYSLFMFKLKLKRFSMQNFFSLFFKLLVVLQS